MKRLLQQKSLNRSLSDDPLDQLQSGDVPQMPLSRDILQLQKDVIDVYEGRVDISTFDEKYQKKIKDYYRFGPRPSTSHYREQGKKAKMSKNTLDLL